MHGASSSRAALNSGRPPQASSLTLLIAIVVEHSFYSNANCSVGLRCQYKLSGGPHVGTTGRDVNLMYMMGHGKSISEKVMSPGALNVDFCTVSKMVASKYTHDHELCIEVMECMKHKEYG